VEQSRSTMIKSQGPSANPSYCPACPALVSFLLRRYEATVEQSGSTMIADQLSRREGGEGREGTVVFILGAKAGSGEKVGR
jgi:hypothetical protein